MAAFDKLAEVGGKPEADPFDLLCHVAFNSPLRTRRERAEMLRKERKDFFEQYAEQARQVLNEMLDKYIEYGTAQFRNSRAVSVEARLKLSKPFSSVSTNEGNSIHSGCIAKNLERYNSFRS